MVRGSLASKSSLHSARPNISLSLSTLNYYNYIIIIIIIIIPNITLADLQEVGVDGEDVIIITIIIIIIIIIIINAGGLRRASTIIAKQVYVSGRWR